MTTLRNANGSVEVESEEVFKLSAYHALGGTIERLGFAYAEEIADKGRFEWAVYLDANDTGTDDYGPAVFRSADFAETVRFMRTLGERVVVIASVDFTLEGI
jgi:hypothetical protein